MKKKYLKKILAIMLATMTVSATPGIASAMSGDSKQAIKDLNEDIKNQSPDKNKAIKSLDQLEKIAGEDDEAKEEVAKTLKEMVDKGLFGGISDNNNNNILKICSPDDLSKIVKIFRICANYDGAQMYAAQGIKSMAQKGLLGKFKAGNFGFNIVKFKQCSSDDLSKIIEIFELCSKHDDSKIYAAEAIEIMANQGVFGQFALRDGRSITFRLCSSVQLSKIIEIFNKCLIYNDDNTKKRNYSQTKTHVLRAISNMSSSGAIGILARDEFDFIPAPLSKTLGEKNIRTCSPEQISQLVRILKENSQGNEPDVAYAILSMEKRDLLEEYSTTEILDMLEACLNNNDAKKNIALVIESASRNNRFKETSPKQDIRVLNILKKCLEGTDAEKNVAAAIQYISFDHNWNHKFDNNQESLELILKMLETCLKSDDAKENVAAAISNIPTKDDPNQAKSLLKMLQKCLNGNEEKREVAYSIERMLWDHKFDNDQESLELIVKMLQECLNSIYAKEKVAGAIERIVSQNLLEKNSPGQILNMLQECSNHPQAKTYVAKAIQSMISNGQFDTNKNLLNQVLDILHICSNDYYGAKSVAEAIDEMVNKGLLNKQSINENLIHSLQRCTESPDTDVSVTLAIKDMAKHELLNECDDSQIQQIINLLLRCSNSSGVDAKTNITEAIKSMAEQDLLNGCTQNQIQQIVDSLIQNLGNNATWEATISAIKSMANRGLLNDCTQNQIQQIVDSLIKNLGNNDTKDAAIAAIEVMIRNELLNTYAPNNILQTVDTLIGHLGNNNTREAATTIITAIAKKGLLNECTPAQIQQMLNLLNEHLVADLAQRNNENTTKIFEILKACSTIDPAKETVANIADMISSDDLFFEYLGQEVPKPRLRNLIDILHSCSETQNHETKAKVAFVMGKVLHKFIEGSLPSKYLPDQISQRIPQIIEMLKRCSEVDGGKFYIAASIRFLAAEGFCQYLTYGQNSNLIDALDNCLKANGTRLINIEKEKIDDFQKGTMMETHKAIQKLQESSFGAGLLEDQATQFKNISNECKDFLNDTTF